MKKIGIVYHPFNEAARPLAEKIGLFLKSRDIAAWTVSSHNTAEAEDMLEGTDFVLSIGGDGTALRAVHLVAPRAIPVTGISPDAAGFLTELGPDEVEGGLSEILEGKGYTDERMLLEAEITPAGSSHETAYYALSDVVMAHGSVARVVYIEASIDDEPLTNYKADGVIVATATGSTGYSMAAGGPVLHPQAKDLILTPITPHISSSYSVVLPETAEVKLELKISHLATLILDGYINLPLESGAVVRVRHSPYKACFLRVRPEISFYRTLEQHLNGKQ